jgi:hypothetical protein
VDSAGAFCVIMIPDVIKQCAKVVSELGGNKFVSTVYAPFMSLQDGLNSDVKTSNGKIENSLWWLLNGANMPVPLSGWTRSYTERGWSSNLG